MTRDYLSVTRRRATLARARKRSLPGLEVLEVRCVLSADAWVSLGDLDSSIESDVNDIPIADPAVLVGPGDANTDAASLLAAGGPGDPSLPGFANVGRASENGTVVYLGGGWAITASHVSLPSSVSFGGVYYAVDTSSVRQLHNSDNSLTDLKMFRVQGDPPLPQLVSSYIATAPPSGHVFMIGNGLTRNEQKFWSVNKTQSPWVWTEIAEPPIATSSTYGGVTIASQRTIRWGDNNVKDVGVSITVGGLTISGFTTQFDHLKFTGQSPRADEAQASAGDSGGAVFSYVGGKWVLSGLMIAVSGPLSGQPSNTALYGNITLMIDLSVYRTEILSILGVVDRQLFYNGSTFDGGNTAINAADDLAIATDKSPYLAGSGLATFASVSSYEHGINGIMIDIADVKGTLTAADFSFKTGNTNDPSTWSVAPAPTAISVRAGAGVGGSDRVEITWANGAITNKWLEVIVKGNDAAGGFNTKTGLIATDVFFWGNKVADSGTSPSAGTFDTTSTDAAQVFSTIGSSKPVTDLRDYNRDGQVTSTDASIVFGQIGSIIRIDIGSSGPYAPVAEPTVAVQEDQASAVAFALSAPRNETAGFDKNRREAFEAALARVFSRWTDAHASTRRPSTAMSPTELVELEDFFDDLLTEIAHDGAQFTPFEATSAPRHR